MRILLWHGYLLSGSGSNIYTANIARAWRSEGHDVLVMCQDLHALELPFVDEDASFGVANDTLPFASAPAEGRCRVARPNIGEILPVYVYDEYEGFRAKRFVELSDEELENYTDANVSALVAAIDDFHPDAIITGHEVMGPYVALKAAAATGTKYLAKLHGSALEYAVKLQDRYRNYAIAGLGGASVVAGGSNYMIRAASSVIPGWEDRAEVVNPGCDVELFRPVDGSATPETVVAFVGKLIASKGVHHLLASLGLSRHAASLRSVIVGYGGYENGLRAMAGALSRGDRESLLALARRGEHEPLDDLVAFLESGDLSSRYWDASAAIPIEFAGRLEHGPLSKVLPTFDVLVVPSVVPEAFGMVAAEAAACAVLPVVPSHSGIGEVGAQLEAHLGVPGLLTFDHRDPIRSLARTLDRLLDVPPGERREMGLAAARFAQERWSWGRAAARLLELAAR